MSNTTNESPDKDLQQIIESARRLGVELDEADAIQWLTAVAAVSENDITLDTKTGVYGHKVTMLDFSDKELAHFRRLGKLVEFEDIPGKVETAQRSLVQRRNQKSSHTRGTLIFLNA